MTTIKSAVSFSLDNTLYGLLPDQQYDPNLLMLGQWIQAKSDTPPSYFGPFPISHARPYEDTASFGGKFISVVDWDTNNAVLALAPTDLHWVFLADAGTGSASTRIIAYLFNNQSQEWTNIGYITLTLPAGTHTVRGFHIDYNTYSVGTASRTGTTVTISPAGLTDNRLAGGRIGHGSTNPSDIISAWKEISSIDSNTQLTVTDGSGSWSSGPYVIEELRVFVATTCDTATNGGLFVAKGVSIDDFLSNATINAAVSTDNTKAVYWLKDASTVTNTAACGIAASGTKSGTSHMVYVVNADAAATAKVFKYNSRAALSVSSGASTSAFVAKTGQQTTSGNLSQYDAITVAIPQHGFSSGVSSIFGVTDTFVYRIPEANVVDSSTSFIMDHMPYAPPGGSSTFATDNVLAQVRYAGGKMDTFLFTTGITSPNDIPGKLYLGKYDAAPNQWQRVALIDTKQQDQSTADAGVTPFPSNSIYPFAGNVTNGILYLLRGANSQDYSQLYALPVGADWDYAKTPTSIDTTNFISGDVARAISPALSTPDCIRYSRVAVANDVLLGSEELGMSTEPFRLYWRTTGITDNTGNWNLILPPWDLTGIGPSDQIQFMFEFRTFGPTCIPARIYGLVCSYEQLVTNANYLPSVANSSVAANRFAWRFATAFGGTVPTLTVYLYNDATNDLILSDNTANATKGTFEKSTNGGGAWGAYNTTDKSNETTYIRYTPSYLPNGAKVRAYLV